jgi:hypothetical protein
MITVVEIEAAIDAAGTLQTFLFSTEGWTTTPTDTPANTWVQPRLQQAGNYRRDLFKGVRTFGPTQPAFGEGKLANPDGKLDAFARYGFDGRRYVVRTGEKGAAYPAEFTIVLVCTMKCALFELTNTSGSVRLILRDNLVDLEKPLASVFFAGTGGVEGTTISGKGARKALAYGTSFSVAPRLIDENNLIYHVGEPMPGYATFAVRVQDGGENINPYPAPFTEQADYAALLSLTVPPGQYGRCSALGLIKLGTKPIYTLTCCAIITDAATHSDTAPSKLGNILQAMAVKAGVAPADINAADVAAVNAARTADYGYLVRDEETALAAMSKMASSASVWVAMDALAQLRMGLFTAPSGTPVFTFDPRNVTSIQRLDTAETSVPVWRVTARSSYTRDPQTTFAGDVPPWYAQWYNQEWPLETAYSDATVRDKHPNAGELVRDVYTGTNAVRADDAGEGARALALYSVERETVQVTVPITPEMLTAVDLGKIVQLKYPRFAWGAGKLMCVLSIYLNLDAMRAEITLWG